MEENRTEEKRKRNQGKWIWREKVLQERDIKRNGKAVAREIYGSRLRLLLREISYKMHFACGCSLHLTASHVWCFWGYACVWVPSALCCCGRMLAINLRSGLLRQGCCRRVTSSRFRKKCEEKEMSKESKERDVQRRFSHCAGPLTYRLRLSASCSFPYACTVYAM